MADRIAAHLVAFARACDLARATAAAQPESRARLGALTLRPSQVRAVEGIRAAFAEFGGALLADPPGTGKTIVALAVAAAFPDVLVLAPSALRAQWERAARSARVTIRFVSLEAMSRGTGAGGGTASSLVIVDEAHHVRTPSTRRYAAVATACVGARVLLLSATPVVNRRADRDALLALFLGAAAATLRPEVTARCVIRRTTDTAEDVAAARPHVRRLPPLDAPLDVSLGVSASIAEAIAGLPPPFPASDGAAALALVRISLAMAWSSSLAALDAALRRRVQRGEALADALEAGRWPTRVALRQWVVADDATQLAFIALDPAHDHVPDGALCVLRTHVSAVRSLRALIAPFIAGDAAARADALRALLTEHPTRRMVVFAGHAATIHALRIAMRADAGVVSITGSGQRSTVRAAGGQWRREDILRALGPLAKPLPVNSRPDDPSRRDMIRVLLATDLLSEGIELQGVGILVHADRAWTPARLEQREGRITRIGTRAGAPVVLVTRFRAPAASTSLLRLDARLARKQRARSRAVRDAEMRAEIDATIRSWATARGAASDTDRASRPGAGGGHDGHEPSRQPRRDRATTFLALVRIGAETQEQRLIVGRIRSPDVRRRSVGRRTESVPRNRWLVDSSARAVLHAVRLGPLLRRPRVDETCEVRTVLARWARRLAERAMLGPVRDARSPLRRRLHECVDRIMRTTPMALRARRGAELESLTAAVSAAAGAGVERELSQLMHTSQTDAELEGGLRALVGKFVASRPPADSRPVLVALLVASDSPEIKSVRAASLRGTRLTSATPTAAAAPRPAAHSRDPT